MYVSGADNDWYLFFNQRSSKLGGQGIVHVNGKNRNQLEKEVFISKPSQMYKSSYYIVVLVCAKPFLGHIWHAREGFPRSVPKMLNASVNYHKELLGMVKNASILEKLELKP